MAYIRTSVPGRGHLLEVESEAGFLGKTPSAAPSHRIRPRAHFGLSEHGSRPVLRGPHHRGARVPPVNVWSVKNVSWRGGLSDQAADGVASSRSRTSDINAAASSRGSPSGDAAERRTSTFPCCT